MAKTTMNASGGSDIAVSKNDAAAGGAAPQSALEKALSIRKEGSEALLKKNFDVAVAKTSEALQLVYEFAFQSTNPFLLIDH